ncbi:MAG: hypothetical protein WBN03_15640 [Desulfobacterales bacterium]
MLYNFVENSFYSAAIPVVLRPIPIIAFSKRYQETQKYIFVVIFLCIVQICKKQSLPASDPPLNLSIKWRLFRHVAINNNKEETYGVAVLRNRLSITSEGTSTQSPDILDLVKNGALSDRKPTWAAYKSRIDTHL